MSFKDFFQFLGPVTALALKHQYIGLFLSVLMGVIGLPLPLEGLIAYAGYRAYQNEINIIPALLAIIFGGVAATVLAYGIVRVIGIAVMKKHIRRFYPKSNTQRYVVASLRGIGKWGLVAGYFLPGVRRLLGPLAALLEFEFFDFIVLSFLGCTIWSTTFFVIGGMVGKDWEKFSSGLQQFLIVVSIVTVLIGVLFFLNELRKIKNRQRGKGVTPT